MDRNTTDHLERIQAAVDFIEARLGEELPTEDIAREAGFSMWHFQRVFAAAVGFPLKDYVRRRRLTLALNELTQTQRRLIEIAIEHGFESQEAFTRSFKSVFGVTPGDCRRTKGLSIRALPKPRITIDYLNHLYEGVNMQPIIKTMPEKKFVGMGTKFISILSKDRDNYIKIPQLWQRYNQRNKEVPHRTGQTEYGICFVVPKDQRSHPEECYYLAGAEVTKVDELPEGFEARTIPAGEYAVFTHKGTLDKLEHTMSYIYGSWLPKSGRKLRDAPEIEAYDQRFKIDSPDSELDIYIPIV